MDVAMCSEMNLVDEGSSPASRWSDGIADLEASLIEPTVSVPPPRWPLFQLPWTLSARGSRRDARDGILLSSTGPCTGSFASPRCDNTPSI